MKTSRELFFENPDRHLLLKRKSYSFTQDMIIHDLAAWVLIFQASERKRLRDTALRALNYIAFDALSGLSLCGYALNNEDLTKYEAARVQEDPGSLTQALFAGHDGHEAADILYQLLAWCSLTAGYLSNSDAFWIQLGHFIPSPAPVIEKKPLPKRSAKIKRTNKKPT